MPSIWPWLRRWFTAYSRRYIRRHFHAVRVLLPADVPADAEVPLVVYAAHPSWWDPLVGLVLGGALLPGRSLYAPIDAAALARYRFFARLGFYGVEPGTARGAATFLRVSRAILREPRSSIWLTPQGRFADPRERPIRFAAGLGHLAAGCERATFVPLALEYCFWEERTAEVLVAFGEAVTVTGGGKRGGADHWTGVFEQKLEAALDRLGAAAQRRDPAAFRTLLSGGAGVGGIYDLWRRGRARLRGETFNPEHGHR